MDRAIRSTAARTHARGSRPVCLVYWLPGITVSVTGKPSMLDCQFATDTVGAARLFIEPAAQDPTPDRPEIHEASARVSYRQETTAVPLTLTGDRLTAVVTIDDEL